MDDVGTVPALATPVKEENKLAEETTTKVIQTPTSKIHLVPSETEITNCEKIDAISEQAFLVEATSQSCSDDMQTIMVPVSHPLIVEYVKSGSGFDPAASGSDPPQIVSIIQEEESPATPVVTATDSRKDSVRVVTIDISGTVQSWYALCRWSLTCMLGGL